MTCDEKPFFSSGLPFLDKALQGILAGDNVVWQMDDIRDFAPFLDPFVKGSLASGKELVYFRYAQHPHLLPDGVAAHCYEIDPAAGFESFISEILRIIAKHGKGVCYVFDCLSDLLVDWYSDRMIGNFFMLACPYLYELDTVAYFVLLRERHTPKALDAIHNTAQVIIDVFRAGEQSYILPIKVFERSSPTLYMLHSREGDNFQPVTRSATTAAILQKLHQPWLDLHDERRDAWGLAFMKAQEVAERAAAGLASDEELAAQRSLLIKMIITRDETLFGLCERYFDLPSLIAIARRMVGTGLIGGKSVGMLLAREIVRREGPQWEERLESLDSFFIGSDVFYTYIIQNKCWWERHRLKLSGDPEGNAEPIREKLLRGKFSPEILKQFRELLNYFGQSPIIVRSSSLLEDAYGNAFSGKYESVFLANQGTPEQRLHEFIAAVRTVYASTMSNDALAYRSHRNLLQKDEQMALLVQRVSGAFYGRLYYPQLAGVGYSFNPFAWNSRIDSTEGVLRLVFGLGTRAVEGHGDDYARIVAINAPMLRPEQSYDQVRKYTQRIVDVLDLEKNSHESIPFEELVSRSPGLPLDIFATRDPELEQRARELKLKDVFPWLLGFDTLLDKTSFVAEMRAILKSLERAYEHPVDIEFTANFSSENDYRIGIVQCRPFQVSCGIRQVSLPPGSESGRRFLETRGPIIGQGGTKELGRIIYVSPQEYGQMSMSDRHAVARLIGDLTNMEGQPGGILLLGPGRWGTKMPALGIPVSFSAIRNACALCEIAVMHEGLTPDISLGTHFFNDLVEMDIVYMALYPGREGYLLDENALLSAENRLPGLLPSAARFSAALRVIDTNSLCQGAHACLHVDSLKQRALVFSAKRG